MSLLWKKNNIVGINWENSVHCTHGYLYHLKILSSNPAVNDSLSIFKNMLVLFTSAKNYSASETLFDESTLKQLEMMGMFYSTQKIVVPVMIIGLENIVFARQLKLIWQNHKLNIEKKCSSTVSLLCILFEDLGCAIKMHAKFGG